jgi:hypothetical protein
LRFQAKVIVSISLPISISATFSLFLSGFAFQQARGQVHQNHMELPLVDILFVSSVYITLAILQVLHHVAVNNSICTVVENVLPVDNGLRKLLFPLLTTRFCEYQY